MFCFIKLLFIITISVAFISCGQSGDKGTANTATSPTTNATDNPLIIPGDPATAAATTIYDLWVLDSINGNAPDSNYFKSGSPYFDFNSEKNTIGGFTGCNGINGKLSLQGQRLKFDSLVVSAQPCSGKAKEFERTLLAGFRSGNTTYKILNDRLHLNVGPGSNYIFRKIRR